ncbi:hypothetical protein ACSW8S_16940 (plasmid) [Clostridium perfringens]
MENIFSKRESSKVKELKIELEDMLSRYTSMQNSIVNLRAQGVSSSNDKLIKLETNFFNLKFDIEKKKAQIFKLSKS